MRRVDHDERLEKAVVANCFKWLNEYRPSAYMEVIGQRRAKSSGTSVGAPDAIVYDSGRVLICEFKRPHGGHLDNGQVLAIECRRRAGVETHVVSNEQEFVDMICGRG